MKIAIVTFTYGDNYGQRLQNYAMQELLKNYADEVYTLPQLKRKIGFKTIVKRFVADFKAGRIKAKKRRAKSFKEFDSENIKYYSESIGSHKKFNGVDYFDYFVVGSDQVWSPFSPDVNSSMFLEFAPNNKRVCFSPSISADTIPLDKEDYYRKCWNGFNSLSVREYKGAEIIENITGRKAEVTLDPTLMFDDDFWAKRAKCPKRKIPEKYLLCYYLGLEQQRDLIEMICEQNNLVLIDIMNDKEYLDIDPFEFLFLIQQADIVFTDSFHGTVFSIIFKTPFVICNRMGSGINMNSRFDTLDQMFNIRERYISNFKVENVSTIQWDEISHRLELQREKSMEFLKKSLST